MQNVRRVTKSFTIIPGDGAMLCRLTGDRNALHVDEEIARKFRYRKPVVHGMLPFSFHRVPGGSVSRRHP